MNIEDKINDALRNHLGYNFDTKRIEVEWNQLSKGSQRFGEEYVPKPEPKIDTVEDIYKLLKQAFSAPIRPSGLDSNFKANLKVPVELIDKSFKFGRFNIHTHYGQYQSSKIEKYSDHNSYDAQLSIIIEDNGMFLQVLDYSITASYTYNEYYSKNKDKLTQISWYTYDGSCEKPILKVVNEIFKLIDVNEVEFIETPDLIANHKISKYRSDLDAVCQKLSNKYLDFKAITESDINKGVYKPSPDVIKYYFNTEYTHGYDLPSCEFPIKDLGVHTIHLRGNAHFSLRRFFDLDAVQIKGPKNVIKRYGYEDICSDDKIASVIKSEKKDAEEKQRKIAEDNKFTLVKKGVTLFECEDKEKIIEFLESYIPTDKDVVANYSDTILEEYTPILKQYNIDRYEIAYWGRFYKYECSGEIRDITYENLNTKLQENDPVLFDTLEAELENCITLETKLVEINFGWPERGGSLLVIEKDKTGKYNIKVEDYDFE